MHYMQSQIYIVLTLSHLSNKSITISYGVSIKNLANKVVETWESRSTFNVSDHEAIDKWDFYEHNSPSELEYGFINYSDLWTLLVDGALVFVVQMKLLDPISSPP